jgi:uncharacterized membrane protein YoaK (UPF0700 family)
VFLAQAHSFSQQARLAVTLAWVAGYTNIVTIIACGTVTSHVSGTTSNLGRDLAEQQWPLALTAASLLAAFLTGAILSGLATELGRRRAWESIYVLPMTIEVSLLAAFAVTLEFAPPAIQPGSAPFWLLITLASLAMGCQNATITRISAGVVRTTHVTGVLTDLGLEIAQLLASPRRTHHLTTITGHASSRPQSARRAVLLLSIVGSFALGAALGTLAFEAFPRWAMFPPVLFLLWIIFQDITRPIAEFATVHTIDGVAFDVPEGLAVYQLQRDPRRKGRVQRLPNLLAWEDRLPQAVRVVVLDLSAIDAIDNNAALELRAALDKLSTQHRSLVIAGIRPDHFQALRRAAPLRAGELDPVNLCTDLELAIARGIMLMHQTRTTRS